MFASSSHLHVELQQSQVVMGFTVSILPNPPGQEHPYPCIFTQCSGDV